MPWFVLLHHECPSGVPRSTHWDLMLQSGDALRTWVLSELPETWSKGTFAPLADAQTTGAPSKSVDAEEIQSHRLDYLTLEGPLTGGRGSVTRLESGTYLLLEINDCHIRATLAGRRMKGLIELSRDRPDTPHWKLSFSAMGEKRGDT